MAEAIDTHSDAAADIPGGLKRPRNLAIAFFSVLVVALAGTYLFLTRFNYAPLYKGLTEAEAASVVAMLETEEVRFKLADGGATVLVPQGRVSATRLAIVDEMAPGKRVQGFELFNESEMGLTDFAQKIKFQRAIQGELARTLVGLEGIADARVHIAIPERTLFRASQTRPKAAVTLHLEAGHVFSAQRVNGVRELVASAVPDLDARNVVVLSSDGTPVSELADSDDIWRGLQVQDASFKSPVGVAETAEAAVKNDNPEISPDKANTEKVEVAETTRTTRQPPQTVSAEALQAPAVVKTSGEVTQSGASHSFSGTDQGEAPKVASLISIFLLLGLVVVGALFAWRSREAAAREFVTTRKDREDLARDLANSLLKPSGAGGSHV